VDEQARQVAADRVLEPRERGGTLVRNDGAMHEEQVRSPKRLRLGD
jgi:hypothetical protein